MSKAASSTRYSGREYTRLPEAVDVVRDVQSCATQKEQEDKYVNWRVSKRRHFFTQTNSTASAINLPRNWLNYTASI